MFGSRQIRLMLSLALGLAVVSASVAAADIPRKINYQGRLTSVENGLPLQGQHDLTFRLYDAVEGGSPLWSEARTVQVDSAGVFSVILGSIAEIGIAFSGPVWLETEVDGQVLIPRREIVSVPFAFRSLDAESLGGRGPEAFLMEGQASSITGDMITDGEITDADIAGGAAIDPAKIAGTAWTSENDGTGSGLDADMLDGLHATAFSDTGHTHDERYYRQTALNSEGEINDGDNPVQWTRLKGVPEGLADGIDDVGGAGDGHSLDAADGDPLDIVYVDNEGNVGINTTAPAEDLDVNGNIHATGTIKSGSSITLDGTSMKILADSTLELSVGGAHALRLQPATASPNVIGGHSGNDVPDGVGAGTISGGGENGYINRVLDDFGTVGGGRNNWAGDGAGATDDAGFATVAGGAGNRASGNSATVGGGSQNTAGGAYSTIGGGRGSSAVGEYITVGGGAYNSADHDYATISGGHGNTVTQNYGVIGGGYGNKVDYHSVVGGGMGNWALGTSAVIGGGWGNSTSGQYATVGGGNFNVASNFATVAGGTHNWAARMYSTIGGGTRDSSYGYYATIPGGADNTADGDYSLAAGRRAKALHHGCFVWADATDADFASTDDNQFLIRASGGVGIVETNPMSALTINSNIEDVVSGTPEATLTIGNPGGTSALSLGSDDESHVTMTWFHQQYFRVISTHGIRFGVGPYAFGTYTDVVIDPDGRVGIGTESPERDLHIVGDNPRIMVEAETINPEINLKCTGDAANNVWAIYKHRSTGDLRFYQGGDRIRVANATGNVCLGTGDPGVYKLRVEGIACATGGWSLCSDLKYKEGIENIGGALSKVARLRGVSFAWKTDEHESMGFPEGRHFGVIAQEVEEVLPEVVRGDGGDDKSVAYTEIIPVLIEAIKELKAQNDDLRRRIEALEG